jgi:hypothetical protein
MSIATTVALVSLDYAKKHLRIPTSNTSVDDILGNAVNQASKLVCGFCNRGFLLGDYTEYHDGHGTQTLYPNVFPINSGAASVTLYISSDREYTADQLVDADDIIVYPEDGKIELDGLYFYTGKRNIKLTYNAGYSLSDMPDDVKLSVCRVVERIWKRSNGGLEGVQSQSIADSSHTFDLNADIIDDIRADIAPYIRYCQG